MNENPIKCIAIDDEPLALSLIEKYIRQNRDLEYLGGFTNTLKAIKEIESGEVELVFCDIQMPGLTGLEFAKILPEDCAVVFITAFEQYALDGFKVNAIDYLLKPVSQESFDKCCKKVKRYLRPTVNSDNEGKNISVRCDRKNVMLSGDDIYYVQAMKDYMILHTKKSTVITHCTMKQMCKQLPTPPFMQVHRSFIVNTNHINSYNSSIINIGDKTIPVADRYKEQVKKWLVGSD